jgi:D-glycerate 3-kinase
MAILRRLVWTSALLHPFLTKTFCFSTRIFHPKPFPSTSTSNNSNQIVSNETKAILFDKASLAPVQNSTQLMEQIDTFYIPLFENLFHKCQLYRASSSGTTVIGISAPQGCGKTTLTEYLKILFESAGWSCLTISIDDFYLTNAEQTEVAASHKSNSLLQFRGNGNTC